MCIRDSFMYSTDKFWDVNKRLLIPFYWKGDIVGFTGRLFEKLEKVKYYTDVQPGYVFNMDAQDWTRKFVIVTEGPFDAITISGVSILGSEINDIQRELIDGLNRKVIVVPDRDAPGEKLINQAIEFGWNVAFPEWEDNVEDVPADDVELEVAGEAHNGDHVAKGAHVLLALQLQDWRRWHRLHAAAQRFCKRIVVEHGPVEVVHTRRWDLDWRWWRRLNDGLGAGTG